MQERQPASASLIGRWKPGGYLAQALRARPVPIELQYYPPLLPRGFSCSGRTGPQPTAITHRWTSPVPPPQADWDAMFEIGGEAAKRHGAAVAAWERANPGGEHCFHAIIDDFLLQPRCPVCGFEAEPVTRCDPTTEVTAYRAIVQSWSFKVVRTFVCRGKPPNSHAVQLDHIYPLALGVAQGVAEEVVAAPVNLQLLPKRANLSKGDKPGMNLDELLERYRAWLRDHPEWTDLVAHRRATGAWPVQPADEGVGRYQDADARDAAHRRRMEPAYALWRRGYTKEEIAGILGLPVTTILGRIQLDRQYCGDSSIFWQRFPKLPLTDAELGAVIAEHARVHRAHQRQARDRRDTVISLPIGVPLDQVAAAPPAKAAGPNGR